MARRITPEEWIAKAIARHGDLYDYSKSVYLGSMLKVIIICRVHGEFTQRPQNHVNRGQGCVRCAGLYRPTTEEWIVQARGVRGEMFDYSKVVYINVDSPVTIICRVHGEFNQTPWVHLHCTHGCPRCGVDAMAQASRLGNDEFVSRAREVHGNMYDYSKVMYQGLGYSVTIICSEHGEFSQNAGNHLGGHACARCAGLYNWSTPEWIAVVREVHGDLYDYSETVYVNSTTMVTIICREHGAFRQVAKDHVKGVGCARCGGGIPHSSDEWIVRARITHGNRYDYSLVIYVNQATNVIIICRKHGKFSQNPRGHAEEGSGCKRCSVSRGEYRVAEALENLGIEFEQEWAFETRKDAGRRRFDFLLPERRVLIEFDGAQHFRPVFWNHSITVEQAEVAFEKVKHSDGLKNDWAKANGYHLLRVSDLETVEDDVLSFIAALERQELHVS
ncbi:very-short-patch-repair endonuclease [Leucobacter exalbidus]|uniref:Very-short-patch-repair endonuclease n=1 Tax=Leucobacter exalbidus TaxID=662960 RepID=A0A940PRT1_9MICO|nr:hypothetical protein [Leucobacter exalbidus]MBP1325055.1 very-short-patch-repair endonuclease [Leucobacter exalbidus]